jgi:hypothetical protein
MAKIRLIKGTTSPTKRNILDMLPTYLSYANTLMLVILLIKAFTR